MGREKGTNWVGRRQGTGGGRVHRGGNWEMDDGNQNTLADICTYIHIHNINNCL